MKQLTNVLRGAEKIAKRYGLEIEEVSGSKDGTYRVEFVEPKKEKRIGFDTTDSASRTKKRTRSSGGRAAGL